MKVEVIRSAVLEGVPHGFLGRRGGVSTGVVAGLNVGWGSGDDRELIAENRRRAIAAVLGRSVSRLGSTRMDLGEASLSDRARSRDARLVTVHQVHSATVVEAGDWSEEDRPHADALVTDRPGILLGILTADCAPVLLADRDAGVVGAAHAGWRGALAGVTEAAVAAMEKLGAQRGRIRAAVGPCIGQRHYEVGHGFAEQFAAIESANRFFSEGPAGKPHFDLEGFVVSRLTASGIGAVEPLGLDTYGDEERFYSYRRATHRREPTYGRQISLIGVGA